MSDVATESTYRWLRRDLQLDTGKFALTARACLRVLIAHTALYVALHFALAPLSIAAGATSCLLAYEHTSRWIPMSMGALASSTTIYSCYYVWRYSHPLCRLKMKALVMCGLHWDLIVLPWAWFVYANFSIMWVAGLSALEMSKATQT